MPVHLTTGTSPPTGRKNADAVKKCDRNEKTARVCPAGGGDENALSAGEKTGGKRGQEAPVKCATTGSSFLLKV